MKIKVKKADLLRVTAQLRALTAPELVANLHSQVRSGALPRGAAQKRAQRAEREDRVFSRFAEEDARDRASARRRPSPIEPDARQAKRRPGEASPKLMRKLYQGLVETMPGEDVYLIEDEDTKLHKAFQDLHDGLIFCKANIKGFVPQESKYWRKYQNLRARLTQKILTTQGGGTGTGTGGDFIEDTLSAQLVPLFRQALNLSQNFEHFDMPTSPFTLPLEGVDVNPYFVPEGTDELLGTSSADVAPVRTPGTGAVTFSAKSFKMRGNIGDEASEDSIIPLVPFMRNKLMQGQAEGFEDVLINGDSTSTHQDSDVTTSTDHRKGFDGLRFLTNSTAKRDNGTDLLVSLEFLNIFVKMGKFSQTVTDTMVVVSPVGHTHLIGDANMITVEKLGPRATLLTGQVGTVFGRPLVLSGKVREDLNASGVYDGVTTNRTIALVVHRPSFMIGDRRRVTLESARDILTGKTVVVTTVRVHFKRVQSEVTTPSARNVGLIFNINTAKTFT